MPKFSTHVALMDPEYKPANFGPGDEVPEWAIEQVGAHVLEPEEIADDDKSGESGASAESGAQDQEQGNESGADDESDDDADDEGDTPPPADEQPDFTAPAPARRGRSRKQ